MQKLTDNEVDGRRRLLSYIARLLSEDEAREFIANVRMVIDVPADLEARVITAFHDVRDAVETVSSILIIYPQRRWTQGLTPRRGIAGRRAPSSVKGYGLSGGHQSR